MAKNIEIKAYASDFAAQSKLAAALSFQAVEVLKQVDTFFRVDAGRLKLREFPSSTAQLIFYQRNNESGPKLSEYHISECNEPESLKEVMDKAYGIVATVSKTRHLYLLGQTRIHFDVVDGLGEFIELEVVLRENDSIADGEAEAKLLMKQLDILPHNLIDKAYVDLLTDQI